MHIANQSVLNRTVAIPNIQFECCLSNPAEERCKLTKNHSGWMCATDSGRPTRKTIQLTKSHTPNAFLASCPGLCGCFRKAPHDWELSKAAQSTPLHKARAPTYVTFSQIVASYAMVYPHTRLLLTPQPQTNTRSTISCSATCLTIYFVFHLHSYAPSSPYASSLSSLSCFGFLHRPSCSSTSRYRSLHESFSLPYALLSR